MIFVEGRATVVTDVKRVKRGTRNVFKHYFGADPEKWDDFWRKQITDPDDEAFVVEVEIDSVASKRY